MPETKGRMFDEFSRLMTDAAEVAHGVRREAENLLKGQVERLLDTMEIVTREEFEAVKEMAAKAREENERLAQRIAALEAKLPPDGAAQASEDPKPTT
ncbi:MAG: accessory factor UbiK family protein [Beijerinckiaceae bacterium]